MKKNKSDYEFRQGQRMMALLIIAILVAGFSSFKDVLSLQQQADKNQIVVWLDSASENIREGIWQIPEKTTVNDLHGLLGVQLIPTVPETSRVKPFSTLFHGSSKQEDHQYSSVHHKLSPVVFKPLSLNRSDAETLTTLDGIGVTLAQKIIRLRENIGKFDSTDQLLQIKGIGEKSLKSLAGQVSVD